MRRTSAALVALALALSACSSDDEPEQALSPAASPSADDDATDGDPTEEPSEEPTEAATTAPGEDGGDAGEDTTGDDDATDGGTPTDEPSDPAASDEPDTGDATPGGPASDTPSTPVTYTAEGSAFTATDEHHRRADYGSRCYLEPAEGETFDECVRLYSNANEAWVSLVEATDAEGNVTITLYRSAAGDFTSAWQAPAEDATTYALGETGWANTQDHFVATGPSGHDVLTWDVEGADPRLVGHLPGEGAVSFTARRIVRRTATEIEVLAVGAADAGITGTRTALGSEEDVALQVYAAWVASNRSAAEDLAVEKVLDELFEDTPTSNDSFGLDGTDCGQAGSQVACRFTTSFDGRTASMTWTLGTVDGSLQVVRIESQS